MTYTYDDALGRLSSVTDNNDPNDANDNSQVDWAYTREDDGDLIVQETQKYGNAANRAVTTTYDLVGRAKELKYPGDGTIGILTLTYTHDDIGRITTINDGTNDRVEDSWKGYLLQRREYASGAYLTHLDDNGQNLNGYGYDSFGQVKNHRWKSSGGTLLAGFSHDYDRLGDKKYQEDLQAATRSELYAYDDAYRITSLKRGQLNEAKTDIPNPSRTQTWTLDNLGNWGSTVLDGTTETRTHNDVNELTARTIGQNPQISLSYDAAGNLTQDGDANGDHKLSYDYRNRLVEVEEKQAGNWVTTGEYKYDALGRRVRKVVTNKGGLNGTTRFLWGGAGDWQCLEELASDDDIVARFTYSPGYIDAVAIQERDLNANNVFSDTNEVVYYHSSTLFSAYALSDASESVVERYRYDAYGACTVLDADGSVDADGLSDVKNPYLFTSRRLDTESGLMQYRFREYGPNVGRFPQRDPLEYNWSFNLYDLAGDMPGTFSDPLGLEPSSDDWYYMWQGAKRVRGWVASGARIGWRAGQRLRGFVNRQLGTLADPIFGGRWPGQATTEEVGAGYNAFVGHFGGYDVGGEFVWGGGGGLSMASCCDENNCRHRVTLKKICVGPAFAVGASTHLFGGLQGKNCPQGLAGWAVEWGALVVSGMAGRDVQAGGGFYGAPLLPGWKAGLMLCKYWILKDDILGPCGD